MMVFVPAMCVMLSAMVLLSVFVMLLFGNCVDCDCTGDLCVVGTVSVGVRCAVYLVSW